MARGGARPGAGAPPGANSHFGIDPATGYGYETEPVRVPKILAAEVRAFCKARLEEMHHGVEVRPEK